MLNINVSIILKSEKGVFLQKRSESEDKFPSHWCFPGGGLEADCDISLESAIFREIKEEIGVKQEDIDNVRYLKSIVNKDKVYVYFYGEISCDLEILPDFSEVSEYGFFDKSKLPDKLTPNTEENIRLYG